MMVVVKSCQTLATPWTVACQGCFVHGILQARILEWVAISFSRGIFPTQESNPGLLHCRQILYQLSYDGNPKKKLSLPPNSPLPPPPRFSLHG